MTEITASAAPGTPEPPRPAGPKAGGGGGSILTKGKWLKITRKGLLVTAMSRIGKEKERGTEMPDGLREEGGRIDDGSMHGSHFLNPDHRTHPLTQQPAGRVLSSAANFLGCPIQTRKLAHRIYHISLSNSIVSHFFQYYFRIILLILTLNH